MRILNAVMVVLPIALFAGLFHSRLVEASTFFALGALYGLLLFRVVSRSVRAFVVMRWAFLLILYTTIGIQADLGIPATVPWVLGFLAGAMAGGYVWFGARAGSAFRQKREPAATSDKALGAINISCAILLLGLAVAHLTHPASSVAAATVLAIGIAAGWALFRFPPPMRFWLGFLLLIPAVFAVLIFAAGATGQLALPFTWAYGALAGILLGGQYWGGPRWGASRPRFKDHSSLERKPRYRRSAKQKQKQRT